MKAGERFAQQWDGTVYRWKEKGCACGMACYEPQRLDHGEYTLRVNYRARRALELDRPGVEHRFFECLLRKGRAEASRIRLDLAAKGAVGFLERILIIILRLEDLVAVVLDHLRAIDQPHIARFNVSRLGIVPNGNDAAFRVNTGLEDIALGKDLTAHLDDHPVELPPPSDEEVEEVTRGVMRRVRRLLSVDVGSGLGLARWDVLLVDAAKAVGKKR